jgi:hypothetical protein
LDHYVRPSGSLDEEFHPINDKQASPWFIHSDVFWSTFFGVFATTISIMAAVLIGFITSTPPTSAD